MMINNVGSPAMFEVALRRGGVTAVYHMLRYYEPWLYALPQDLQSTSH
jgi:hypothetical protein